MAKIHTICVCAARCAAMCAAIWCVLPEHGLLGVLGTFYEDLQGEWMILERISCSMLEEVKEVFRNDLSVAYIGGVCGWEGVRLCVAAHSSVWPHTPCVGVFGLVLIPTLRINPF